MAILQQLGHQATEAGQASFYKKMTLAGHSYLGPLVDCTKSQCLTGVGHEVDFFAPSHDPVRWVRIDAAQDCHVAAWSCSIHHGTLTGQRACRRPRDHTNG